MRPVEFLGEARKKTCCSDTAGRPAADIGHVGEIAFQLLLVVVPQRHAPRAVAGGIARGKQFSGEGLIVGEQPACDMAQRDHACSGERRDVHHRGGIEALGIGQRIAQDEPPLGVGIENLYGLPRHAGDDVAGLGGAAAGMFSVVESDHVGTISAQARKRQARWRRTCRICFIHFRRGFRDAARVEDSADEHHRRAVPAAGVVEHNQLGRLARALRHRQQGTIPSLHIAPTFRPSFHSSRASLPARRVGRRADIAREVAQALGQVHACAYRLPLAQTAPGGSRLARHGQNFDVRKRARFAFFAFHGVEAIGAFGGHQRHLARFPGCIAAAGFDIAHAQRKGAGAGFLRGLDRGARRIAVLAFVQLRLFAQPDEQHALRRKALDAVQDQRSTELAFHVAAAQDFAERTLRRAVECAGSCAQFAAGIHTHGDTGCGAHLRRAAFCAKLQRLLLPFFNRTTTPDYPCFVPVKSKPLRRGAASTRNRSAGVFSCVRRKMNSATAPSGGTGGRHPLQMN